MSEAKTPKQFDAFLLSGGLVRSGPNAFLLKEWSTEEVRYFVFLDPYNYIRIGPKYFMQIKWGLRNDEVENFAYECWRDYGGPNLRDIEIPIPIYRCSNHFFVMNRESDDAPVDRAFELNNSKLETSQAAAIILERLTTDVFPLVRNIRNKTALLETLKNDDPVLGWTYANAALRCPQIIALESMRNTPEDEIWDILSTRSRTVSGQIQRTPGITVDSYLRASMQAARRFRTN